MRGPENCISPGIASERWTGRPGASGCIGCAWGAMIPGGVPEFVDGTRDLRASMREPGGGLKVLVEGLGIERSTGGSEVRPAVERTLTLPCPDRGPTILKASEERSRDGLDASDGRAESNEAKLLVKIPLLASCRGEDLLLSKVGTRSVLATSDVRSVTIVRSIRVTSKDRVIQYSYCGDAPPGLAASPFWLWRDGLLESPGGPDSANARFERPF